MISLAVMQTSVQYGILVLVLVIRVVAIQSIPLHQLHTAITTDIDDLLRLFETNSADSVPEYEVIPIIAGHRSRRDVAKPKHHFTFSAFGRHFHLELEPNDDVISKSLVVTVKKPGNIWTKKLYEPMGTFYQGHVISDPKSHVAVREVRKSGELTGAVLSGNYLYRLHPLTDNVKKKLSLNSHQGYHVITKKNLKYVAIPGFFPEPVPGPGKSTHERNRARRSVGPKYIEAMILLDKVSSDYYGKTSMDFILSVANMVHRLYRDPSIGIDVAWVLTKIFIIETYEEGLDFNKQNIKSAVQYLKVFSDWAAPRNPDVGTAGHYDNGVLLSRRICGLQSCSLGGVAYSGVPCSTKAGYSINNGNGIDAAFYVAHEMGHNFGIPHDSGECNKNYIMDPGQGSGPNAFKWSSCSKQMFKSIFSRVTCYNDKPPKQYDFPTMLPGYKYDGNAQCKMMNGPQYVLCPIMQSNCALLFCYKSGGCSSAGTPPVDGTPCGKRKWCIGGKCEDVGSSVPPSVDGAWGAWEGDYSKCSRSCGVGVKYRTRQCNKPKPQFDGKPCPGSAIGDWRTCNKQACPGGSDHYRLYQCKKKLSSYTSYYIRGGEGCHLACSDDGATFTLEGLVADGTKYSNNPQVHDLCIAGKRVETGCDDEIDSGAILDRCKKCLGDGSTCQDKQSTTFIWKTAPYGDCSESCAQGFRAQKVNCVRKDDETGVSRKFCDLGNKPDSKVPCNTQPCQAKWEPELWGQCSKRCGGGERKRLVPCTQKVAPDIFRNVEYYYCNMTYRPHGNESCNNIPCGPSWSTGDWSKCVGGRSEREIHCIDIMADGKVVHLNETMCNAGEIDLSPETVKNCTVITASSDHITPCAVNSIFLLLISVLCSLLS